MKKFFKVVGIILGGLIGLIIVVHIILNVVFSIQLKNKINELKAQGKPTTIAEIVPPPVPDEENAAMLYNKAFVLMTSGEGGKPYIPNKERGTTNKMIKAIEEVESFSDISKWIDKQRKEIPQLIDSKGLKDIYQLLKEGSQKPKCNFNLEYEKGFEMLATHFSQMRSAVKLLCVKALLEAESGNAEEAFDTLLIGLKMSNHLKDEPILTSQLVRVACDRIIIDDIEGIADSKGITPEQANLIMNELSNHEGVGPFVKSIDVERVSMFEQMLHGKLFRVMTWGWSGETPLRIKLYCRLYPTYIFRPIQKKDFMSYLTSISKMEDNYNMPYYKVAQEISINQQIFQLPEYYILTRMLIPSLDNVRETQTRYQAIIEVCKTGLALKIYKAKTGTYPETLSFLSELPIDPFSGKGLIYKKSADGFILYSFGPNMKDDGGISPRTTGWHGDYDIIWGCWDCKK